MLAKWGSEEQKKKRNLSSQFLKTIICDQQYSNSVNEWENKKASCLAKCLTVKLKSAPSGFPQLIASFLIVKDIRTVDPIIREMF